ncbi:hypothetical protein EI534_19595 [Pseudomonas frederiksbergensis]|nr:hypothetical protein [Pseudomonas frederiksbergensis]
MSVEESTIRAEIQGLARTKLLGAFYTPSSTAELLAQWAVRTGDESVLEPSSGSGALIKAVIDQAKKINGSAKCKILAFDIDPAAVKNVKAQNLPLTKVVLGDFFNQGVDEINPVDLIIANPPFHRHHAIEKKMREALRKRFRVPGTAGIWASFILHALSFLKNNGRLATIVPRSVLFTRHGDIFMKRLCGQFKEVGVYEFHNRPSWSTHAEEVGAVILADEFNSGTADFYTKGKITESGELIVESCNDSSEFLKLKSYSSQLGEIARLSIGAVTGRNKVFLLSEGERLSAGILKKDVVPVVSRSKHICGAKVTKKDLLYSAVNGEKTWLLQPAKLTPVVKLYLGSISEIERQTVVWFKKRNPWWLVQTDGSYDAVLTYMNDGGPRIALLESKIVCTNTLHRLSFVEGVTPEEKQSVVLGLYSTFGQVAAEKIGRAYGGGVLKFELGEARKLPVLSKNVNFDGEVFLEADRLMRLGKKEETRELVDAAFMPAIFGDGWKDAQAVLLKELSMLRVTRRGLRGKELING